MKKLYLFFIAVLIINITNAQNKAYGDTTWVDSIDFESPYINLSIDTSAQNLWQIGVPSQIILDSAYSPIHAIMTDTTNNYPINNHSYFDITLIRDYTEPVFMFWNLGISIRHKFNTDTLKDGGFLSISYDHGQNFINVIEDYSINYGVPPNPWSPLGPSYIYSFNDTLIDGNYGFSGNSDGWIKSGFFWYNMMVKNTKSWGDTAIIRFNFISDSVNTDKEGWLIDDIRFFWADIGGNVNETINNSNCKIYPNPTTGKITIQAENIIGVEVMDITGKTIKYTVIASKAKQSAQNNEIATGYHPRNDEIDLSQQPKGIYIIKITTNKGVAVEKVVLE